MRIHDGYDARDSYERAGDAMGENVHNRNDDIESRKEIPGDTVRCCSHHEKFNQSPIGAASVECCYVAEFDGLAKKDGLWAWNSKTRRK